MQTISATFEIGGSGRVGVDSMRSSDYQSKGASDGLPATHPAAKIPDMGVPEDEDEKERDRPDDRGTPLDDHA